jgi:hypothetical protein
MILVRFMVKGLVLTLHWPNLLFANPDCQTREPQRSSRGGERGGVCAVDMPVLLLLSGASTCATSTATTTIRVPGDGTAELVGTCIAGDQLCQVNLNGRSETPPCVIKVLPVIGSRHEIPPGGCLRVPFFAFLLFCPLDTMLIRDKAIDSWLCWYWSKYSKYREASILEEPSSCKSVLLLAWNSALSPSGISPKLPTITACARPGSAY